MSRNLTRRTLASLSSRCRIISTSTRIGSISSMQDILFLTICDEEFAMFLHNTPQLLAVFRGTYYAESATASYAIASGRPIKGI